MSASRELLKEWDGLTTRLSEVIMGEIKVDGGVEALRELTREESERIKSVVGNLEKRWAMLERRTTSHAKSLDRKPKNHFNTILRWTSKYKAASRTLDWYRALDRLWNGKCRINLALELFRAEVVDIREHHSMRCAPHSPDVACDAEEENSSGIKRDMDRDLGSIWDTGGDIAAASFEANKALVDEAEVNAARVQNPELDASQTDDFYGKQNSEERRTNDADAASDTKDTDDTDDTDESDDVDELDQDDIGNQNFEGDDYDLFEDDPNSNGRVRLKRRQSVDTDLSSNHSLSTTSVKRERVEFSLRGFLRRGYTLSMKRS